MTEWLCGAGLSTEPRLQDAVSECVGLIESELADASASLVFAFASGDHGESLGELPDALAGLVGDGCLLGCSGEMIAGGGREIESGSALSVLAAVMPDSRVEPFRVTFEPTADGLLTSGCPEDLGESDDVDSIFLLADPFSSSPQSVFDRISEQRTDNASRGIPVLGGMASGGRRPGDNHLFLGNRSYRDGAVGEIIQ